MNLVLFTGLDTSYLIPLLSSTVILGTILLLFKLCLSVTVIFGKANQPPQLKIPKIHMMRVNVPFAFRLKENSNSSYYDGVDCTISSEVSYWLEAFWGVNIHDVHVFLTRPWNFNDVTSLRETSLGGHCQQVNQALREGPHEGKTIKLELSRHDLDLGTPPRHSYPLVVILVRQNLNDLQPDETIALVNIVHIKDNVCTHPTSLLSQYLKQANGRLSALKQLYVASENSIDYASMHENKDSNEPWCLVCQVYPISRALLPCRHTCVCASCFYKIKACPLCRSPIRSYFTVRSEDYSVEPEKPSFNLQDGSLSQWFQDRITDFLGFEGVIE